MLKDSFKLCVISKEGVSSGMDTKDNLATYLASSLGLIPPRGKGIVAVKLIQLFSDIANKREGEIKCKGGVFPIKNGAMKVEDIHKWLLSEGVDIGTAQLYNTYIRNFINAGIITKKKYSMYGLRSKNLKETLHEAKLDWEREFNKILDHAARLDTLK